MVAFAAIGEIYTGEFLAVIEFDLRSKPTNLLPVNKPRAVLMVVDCSAEQFVLVGPRLAHGRLPS